MIIKLSRTFAILLFAGGAFSYACSGAESSDYEHNWPHWRGPKQNGLVVHGNPPLTWSETENVKWKVPIPGLGHATPIIWEDQIYVLSAVPAADESNQLHFMLLCYDRETGRQLWSRVANTESPFQDIRDSNSYASGSPVTDGEVLIVPFGSYGLYAYDLDGERIWSKDQGKVEVTFGEGSSPALVGDVVIALQDNVADSYIYAFDRMTGRELWKKQRDEGDNWTTPYILERDGKTQVVVNGSSAIISYEPMTGEIIWQCSGLGRNVTPMVVADENNLYAMSGQRTTPMAMGIRLGGTGDLSDTDAVLWRVSRGTPYVASPLLYDGKLYFFQHVNALLTCLDAPTGEVHYTQERLPGMTSVYASPIGVNDRIYLTSREGITLVLEKSTSINVLASNELDDVFSASPVVVGDVLYLRGEDFLYALAEE